LNRQKVVLAGCEGSIVGGKKRKKPAWLTPYRLRGRRGPPGTRFAYQEAEAAKISSLINLSMLMRGTQMQINNHITPSSLGQGARPDHAGGANGRGQQFQAVAEAVEPAATTDTTDAVAPVEETEETTGPGKSGQSPAHLARAV
jgi:hypothetical protein